MIKKTLDNNEQKNTEDSEDLNPLTENTASHFPQGDVSIDDFLKNQVKKSVDDQAIKKRKDYIIYGSIGGVLLLMLFFVFSGGNAKGPIEFGICSTFLEMNTPYPHTLQYYGVEGSKKSIRIYYSTIDPFGQYKSEMIDCKFKDNKPVISEAFINRRPIEKSDIQKFNKIVPVLLTTDLYLDLPPNWKNQSIR